MSPLDDAASPSGSAPKGRPEPTADDWALLQDPSTALRRLAEICADPRDAYVISPAKLSISVLSTLYPAFTDADLRQRMRAERWTEQRAVFQAGRMRAFRDAVVQAQVAVMVSFTLDHQLQSMTSLVSRRDALEAVIFHGLEEVLANRRGFDGALRDACRELREVEKALGELLPPTNLRELTLGELAQADGGSAISLAGRLARRLQSLTGQSLPSEVFTVVDEESRPVTPRSTASSDEAA